MTYCSLEEAWGSDFKDANYFAKVNNSSTIQSRVPPELTQKGLENSQTNQSQELDKYFPSYSGGVPSVKHINTAKSNIVPYQISFPDRSKRNYLYPVENTKDDNESDKDSAIDLLEDNDHDIRFIDKQRRVKPEYEPNYLTSEDYFLYKKYLNLAQKYKEKLRKKYKNFVEEEGKDILESFGNMNIPTTITTSYSIKDLLVLIIVGIFIIFALDIFVKMGAKIRK